MALLDESGHLRGDHFGPCGVAGGDLLQHLPREDAEVVRVEIVERHEAAAVGEVAVELLQLGRDLQVVDGGEFAALRVLERIDVELEVVFEEPAEGLEDAAGELV